LQNSGISAESPTDQIIKKFQFLLLGLFSMTQRMPVVRQLQWMGLIPQFVAIAMLAVVVHVAFPNLRVPFYIFIAALIYLVFCRFMRARFVRDHKNGMRAYHAQKFREAISHYEASYRFFSAHRRLDKWRSLFFGVVGPNPYRVVALCNMAYCHAQDGDGRKAIELYEEALREEPDCALAKASLKMLHSVSNISNATPGA
jgi:hypothetical protein